MIDKLVKMCRWVQVGKDANGAVVVDGNLWLDGIDSYTANVRGFGSTVEIAAEDCLLKIESING